MTKSIKKTQSVEEPKMVDAPQSAESTAENSEKQTTVVESPEKITPVEISKDGQIHFSEVHYRLIRNQIARDLNDGEFEMLMMMAVRFRLDPLAKQLTPVVFNAKDKEKRRVSYITNIDGYRLVAHRTGQFAGIDEPIFTYDSRRGALTHCSITVYKMVQGVRCPFSAKVRLSEYNTGYNNWKTMPETMIAKVAEAHALRKAFPQELSGIYTDDEMARAQAEQSRVQSPGVTIGQIKSITELMGRKGVDIDQLKNVVQRDYKCSSLKQLKKHQADHLIRRMEKLEDTLPEADMPIQEAEGPVPDQNTEAIVANELGAVDLDEVDQGIEKMRNDAKEGAMYEETIH